MSISVSTNKDVFLLSADETTVYNPSGTAVWLACADGVRQAAPGAVLRLR